MNLKDYILKERVTIASLSKAIGAHAPDVSRWASGERPIPVEKCVAIEIATNGKVTRKDLKPNDWQKIWPELSLKT